MAHVCQVLQNEDCWSEIKMEKVRKCAFSSQPANVVVEVTALPKRPTKNKRVNVLSAQMSL